MYCQICTNLGGSSVDFTNRLSIDLVNHSKLHRSQIDNRATEAEQIYFDWCFPISNDVKQADLEDDNNFDDEANRKSDFGNRSMKISVKPKGEVERSHLTITDRIRSLIRSLPGHSIQCNICQASIRFIYYHSPNYTTILNHVYGHLNKQLFSCRHCDFVSCTLASMKGHIYRRHKLSFVVANYIDTTEDSREEILAKFNSCFTINWKFKKKLTSQSIVNPKKIKRKPSKLRPTSVKPEKRGTNPPTIACSKILRQFGNDGQIWCRLCSKFIRIKSRGSSYNAIPAINHASGVHLKKKIYSCKLCSNVSCSRDLIMHHLRDVHKSSSIGNFIDNSKKYEAAIIETINECFDQNRKDIVVDEELPSIAPVEKKRKGIMVPFYDCNICSFSTKYEKLIQQHVILRHLGLN